MPSLARYLRFCGKKRGDRRTGSSRLGSFGYGCVYALFFLAGIGSLATILIWFTIPELRVNRDFIEHTCLMRDKRIDVSRGRDGPLYAPQFQVEMTIGDKTWRPWVPYEITDVHTQGQGRSQAILDRFELGERYPCWYDPRDPRRVVLSRGYSWFAWLLLLLPVSFLVIGGAGLSYGVWSWGKSTERRAALSQRSAGTDDESASERPRLPNVPSDASLTDSAGTNLAFRLPSAAPGWNLLALLVACLVWNGVVAGFVAMSVREHLAGRSDWWLSLFLVPFALVGLGMVVVLLRQLLINTGVGPTIVEISAHPLYPGGRYELFISQAGRLNMTRLRVALVCEEEATYRQGTNSRTTTRRVHEQEVFCRGRFEIQQGLPFTSRCTFEVPAGAMHSFRAEHNKIDWKIVVEGTVAAWPDFERSFLVHVYPGCPGSEAA